jgi:hypothetical protein
MDSFDGESNSSNGCAGRLADLLKADLLKTWFPSVAVQLLRLLAGGHLIQCGRPDIPGTEEKKSQRKKIAPNSNFSPGTLPARSEESAFLCSQSSARAASPECTPQLCYAGQ